MLSFRLERKPFLHNVVLGAQTKLAIQMSFSIKDNFKELLQSGDELCDATLVSSDGSSIPVHKLVLATRSTYFKAAFYGELASDTARLHFEADVLEAIKRYCYADAVADDILKRYGFRRNEALSDDLAKLKKSCGFFVRLTVAADFLLLPGLQRMLWELAFKRMSYGSRQHFIPAIYSAAKAGCAEELKVLAWHAYWMYQQEAKKHKIETDTPFEDPFLPSDANYEGWGVILLLGCSEEGVNGEYYGEEKYKAEYSIYRHTLFTKNLEAVDGLAIIYTTDEDASDRSDDEHKVQYYRKEGTKLHRLDWIYTAKGWDCDGQSVFDRWKGAKMPPMSFMFRWED